MEQEALDRDAWLARIKRAILEVEPAATVLLYGSRARGDARPDSDWDFLVLLDGPVDYERGAHVRSQLYPIEWETGQIINAVVHNREEWQRAPMIWTPFHKNVQREAIEL